MKKTIQNLFRIMIKIKMMFLVVMLGSSGLNAEVWSQQKKIDLQFDQLNLIQLFEQIQQKTAYRFVFNHEDVQGYNVNGAIKGKTIVEILDYAFTGKPLKYEIIEDHIVISKIAQQPEKDILTIKGRVTDAKGHALPGVTVRLKNTNFGAATDADGKYELAIGKEYATALIFTFVGMKEKEVEIKSRTEINVQLEEETSQLEDVVVTGYFNKSKSSFTGAVTQVKREEIQKFGSTNILNVLQIIDPSFKIKENNEMGSDPNTLPDFFVRGEGSFMGNSNIPTFIMDGYEVELSYIFDMDVERIESISILKDASATIYYGSRAANGVVIVETRRPERGELLVNYANRTSLSIADLSDYNLMNAAEKLEFERQAGLYTSDIPSAQDNYDKKYQKTFKDIARGVNTDWIAQPVRNAVSHSHSLYISGGNEAVTYGLSGNYNRNNGVIKKSARETYGLTFDLTYRLREKLNIRNSFSFTNTLEKNSPYGSFSNYAKANPYNPIYDENGKFIKSYNQHPQTQYNYLYNASLEHRDLKRSHNITNNLMLDYFFTPDFRFKAELALTKLNSNTEKYTSPEDAKFKDVKELDEKGLYEVGNGRGFSYNINLTLTYNLLYKRHNLYTGLGVNLQQSQDNSDSYAASGFLDERFSDVTFALKYATSKKPTSLEAQERLAGFLGNINYSFDNRYFADLSARLDGSSKYGADKRYALLWATGIGWNLHNEAFLKDHVSWLKELKIRGSIGLTGNQNFDPYMSRTTFKFYDDDAYYNSLGVYFIQFGNKDLKWQKSLKKNIGLDLTVLDRRVSLSLNYYDELTKGLLLPVTVAPSLGFSSYTENYGEQSNRGYEFDFSAILIRNKNFDWAVSFSGTHNRNRIEKISDALRSINEKNNQDEKNYTKPVSIYEEGESLSAIKAVRSLGINPQSGKEIYLTKEGKITEIWDPNDKVTCGDLAADLEGTIGTNLMWKQFTLNALFRYSFGGQVYNQTLVDRIEGADPTENADRRAFEARWKKPGDHTFYKDIADRDPSRLSSRFVEDNNYLEMSNISLFYRFKRELISKWGLSNLKIGLNMANTFHVSTVKRERGTDYPFARQFTFSLNLNF